jgi:hypothetical protein
MAGHRRSHTRVDDGRRDRTRGVSRVDARSEPARRLGTAADRRPFDGGGVRSDVLGAQERQRAVAIDDETVATALLASHELAVGLALDYLERQAPRGRDGVERLRGEGFVAASYRHRMSRAGDPQLHTHVVAAT